MADPSKGRFEDSTDMKREESMFAAIMKDCESMLVKRNSIRNL